MPLPARCLIPPRPAAPANDAFRAAAKVRDTLINALQQIHSLLSPEQRQRLAYLIRTGVLAV